MFAGTGWLVGVYVAGVGLMVLEFRPSEKVKKMLPNRFLFSPTKMFSGGTFL